jgi:aspartate aminotransferase
MFETGLILKKKYGDDKVFDFSLGNPDLPSPELFNKILVSEAARTGAHLHGYMQNKGYPETCAAIAQMLEKESGLPFTENQIVMTCGRGRCHQYHSEVLTRSGRRSHCHRSVFHRI